MENKFLPIMDFVIVSFGTKFDLKRNVIEFDDIFFQCDLVLLFEKVSSSYFTSNLDTYMHLPLQTRDTSSSWLHVCIG